VKSPKSKSKKKKAKGSSSKKAAPQNDAGQAGLSSPQPPPVPHQHLSSPPPPPLPEAEENAEGLEIEAIEHGLLEGEYYADQQAFEAYQQQQEDPTDSMNEFDRFHQVANEFSEEDSDSEEGGVLPEF
jgi:hypothetical protein